MEQKVSDIIETLKTLYPNPMCALHYSKDYELMIAVRLSAQCTDARVNLVTPHLFAAYPTLEAMAAAPIEHVEELVHSCGFYKHKARDIVLACQMLLSHYGGKVPGTMEELLEIITWKQLGLYLNPIVILNVDGYYDPLLEMLHKAVGENFMRSQHLDIWRVAYTPEEAVEMLYTTPLWSKDVRKYAAL